MSSLRLPEKRDRIHAIRLRELRAQIRKGLDSGEATSLNIGDIKARGRRRLAAEQAFRERPTRRIDVSRGRPARYALARRRVVIFLGWDGSAIAS
jgi:hypothetical protein